MNPTILFGSLFMFMLVGDLGTTFLGLSIGMVEINPIGAWFISSFGLLGFALFAIIGKVLSFNCLAWLHKKSSEVEIKTFLLPIRQFIEINVIALIGIFIGVFCWNSFWLYSVLGVI